MEKFVEKVTLAGKFVYRFQLEAGDAVVLMDNEPCVVQGPGMCMVAAWKAPKMRGNEAVFCGSVSTLRRWIPGNNVAIRTGRLNTAWMRHFAVCTNDGLERFDRLPNFDEDGGLSGKDVYRLIDQGEYGPYVPDGWLACPAFYMSGTSYVVVRKGSPKLMK